MGRIFQSLLLFVSLVSIPFFSAFGEEPVIRPFAELMVPGAAEPLIRVAVTDAQPAIREISKGAIGSASSPEAKKVRIIEIVSHAIRSSNETRQEVNEVSAKSEKPVANQKNDMEVETEVADESLEKADHDAETEETFNDGESDDLEKKIAAKSDEAEEEPCDCGTIAEGECAPCPDEDSDQ